MAQSRIAGVVVVFVAIGLLAVPRLAGQTPVPSTVIFITGTSLGDPTGTTAYRAFQNSGDPFRVICSEPCTADLNAIYGLYAGFAPVRQTIVGLFGVEPLARALPFDIHIEADRWCGPPDPDRTALSGLYTWYTYSGVPAGSFGCFWFTDPGRYNLPFQYPDTSTQPYHLITAHEFTHTEFYDRHWYSYEDFANAIAFYIAKPGGGTITDPCDDYLNVRGTGKLIWGLCHQNGFQYSHLAPAFSALAALYDNGQGQTHTNSTSVWQFRSLLNQAVAGNTLDAFMASRATDPLEPGSNTTLPAGGGRASALNSLVTMLLSPTALTTNTLVHVEAADELPSLPPGIWAFDYAYRILRPNGTSVQFSGPTYLQVKYDPSVLIYGTLGTFGIDESTLKLYQFNGTSFQEVPGSRVDPSRMIVSGSVTSTETLVLAASSTLVTPTFVVPRAVSTPDVHTRLVLRNHSLGQIVGQVVFHAQGVPAGAGDPTLPYSIAPNKTLVLDDVVASLGATGAGSIDVLATSGGFPEVHAVNIETTSTFPGSVVPVPPAAAAFATGDRVLLTAPGNLQRETFGFVVRTFGAGASFTVTTRDAAGAVVATTPLSYGANTMEQVAATTFTGGATLTPSQSYDISMTAGNALILLEEAGLGTFSHDFRLAERIDLSASAAPDALYLPKAIEQTNPDGTAVRTALQLTNPSTATITGIVRFKPASGSTSGLNFSIAPGVTKTFPNIVATLNQTGAGTLDVQSTSGPLPVAFARVIYSGPSTPWQVAGVSSRYGLDVLQPGDKTVLVAPTSSTPEFRIGVRTFNKTFAMTITIYDADGFFMTKMTRTFAANTITETSAASLFGVTLPTGAIIEMLIDGGAGAVYGTAVNTTTGAVNYQIARRLPYY